MAEHQVVEEKINAVEAEMKKVGMWMDQPPENMEVTGAFGSGTMAFEQWLQFIFIPRVRSIIAEKGEFPNRSQVSQKAFREWKQWGNEDQYDPLIEKLQEFDGLFNEGA